MILRFIRGMLSNTLQPRACHSGLGKQALLEEPRDGGRPAKGAMVLLFATPTRLMPRQVFYPGSLQHVSPSQFLYFFVEDVSEGEAMRGFGLGSKGHKQLAQTVCKPHFSHIGRSPEPM